MNEGSTSAFRLSGLGLLSFYILCVAFASAAIPLGNYYLKFDWLGGIAVSAFALTSFVKKRGIESSSFYYVMIALGYLALNGVVSATFGPTAFVSRSYWSYYFQFALAFLIFVSLVSFRLDTNAVVKALGVWVNLALAACVLAILQALLGDILVDKILFIPYYESTAISSKYVAGILASTAWFSEASWFGSFLVVPIIYVAFRLSSENVVRRRYVLNVGTFVILLTGLLLGYSLTATISVAVGLVFIGVMFPRSRMAIGFAMLIALVILLYFWDSPLIALQVRRFTELWYGILNFTPGSTVYGSSTSLYVRSIGFGRGISDFLQHPIFGVGMGQGTVPYDSGLITLMAEQGVVGCIIYFWLPVYVILRLSRLRRSRDRQVALLATFLISGLIADYANGLVTYHPFHLQRWLLISIAFSWLWSLRWKRSHVVRRAVPAAPQSEQFSETEIGY
tara:strand:- start:20070 stop:21422 length:1353 start_codon:yes stop_codon:yes gene_type:complete